MPAAAKTTTKKKPATKALDGRRNNKFVKRNENGRPAWEPERKTIEVRAGIFTKQTPEQAMEDAKALVRHYGSLGYSQEVIGKLMNPPMSDFTLRKLFAFELEHCKSIQNARVAGAAFAMAASGQSPTMTIFWLKTQMGWKQPVDDTGEGALMVESMPGDEGL